MTKRLLLIALYIIALVSLAPALHLPLLMLVFWVLALIAAIFPKMRPIWRLGFELALAGITLGIFSTPWAPITQSIIALAVLTISMRKEPSPERAIVGSLLIVTIASFIYAPAAFAFIPLIGAAVLALAWGESLNRENQRQQLRLGVGLALITALASVAASLIM